MKLKLVTMLSIALIAGCIGKQLGALTPSLCGLKGGKVVLAYQGRPAKGLFEKTIAAYEQSYVCLYKNGSYESL